MHNPASASRTTRREGRPTILAARSTASLIRIVHTGNHQSAVIIRSPSLIEDEVKLATAICLILHLETMPARAELACHYRLFWLRGAHWVIARKKERGLGS